MLFAAAQKVAANFSVYIQIPNGGIDMKFKNVLLASDFDGTLTRSDGVIDEKVISAIKYFISEGGNFTVCTGRIHQGFHLFDEAYINSPVIMGNGAMLYDCKNEKILYENPIGDEGVAVFDDVLAKFPEVAVEFYNAEQISTVNAGEVTLQHFEWMKFDYVKVAKPSDAKRPWTKVMIYADKYSQEVQALLEKHSELSFLRTTESYIEVLANGVNKGVGLLRLGELLGCSPENIYAAGDGYNDVDMLKAAAIGFVPESGMKEALAVADRVTRSNNDGCIANVIEILDTKY